MSASQLARRPTRKVLLLVDDQTPYLDLCRALVDLPLPGQCRVTVWLDPSVGPHTAQALSPSALHDGLAVLAAHGLIVGCWTAQGSLAQQARAQAPDLIVASAIGADASGLRWLAALAPRLLREAGSAFLIVRGPAARTSRCLLALDGSATVPSTVSFLARFPLLLDREVHAAQLLPNLPDASDPPTSQRAVTLPRSGQDRRPASRQQERDGQIFLLHAVRPLRAMGCQVRTIVLRGVVERTLVDHIRANPIDVLVIGMRAATAWQNASVGSISRDVLAGAFCSLLIVRERE